MTIRLLSLALLAAPLAACAGHVADYVGPREGIVEPQLTRYGLNLRQSNCIAARLSASLNPRQLRTLASAAETVRQGYFDPDRLTVRDLLHVASSQSDSAIGLALVRAAASCDATPELIARAEAPRIIIAPPPPRPPAWLNLGAAPTGQAIAIDASTLEQQGTTRTAWFRLTDPAPAPPNRNTYRLRLDCTARTINSLARRRQEADGSTSEFVEYPDNPLPVEGGTVMEIAFLSLCS
ncbi:MAG: hypothetical protein ACT4N8_15640 [Sphingosinicella sp.]|uniref:hypothetical protein n=1 Tax=Sphingosinicella sp. TaxID=1917971 RepID=UPI0040381BCE